MTSRQKIVLLSGDTILADELDTDDLKSVLEDRGMYVAEGEPMLSDFSVRDIADHLMGTCDPDDMKLALDKIGLTAIHDGGCLDEARARLMRGELRECLYQIERALPDSFAGLTERIEREGLR